MAYGHDVPNTWGVRVDPVDELGEVALEKLTGPVEVAGKSDA